MRRRVRSQAADRARQDVDDLRPELRRVSVTVPRLPWLEHTDDDEDDPDNTKEDDE